VPDGSQSLQSIIARRQSRGLFGREAQLDRFAANLELPVDDPRKRFLFNVHGVSGVGKTLLLKQLRQVADEHGVVGAGIDHRVFSAVEAMGELARQLAGAGIEMKEFTRLDAVYEQRLSEIGADPKAPSGVATVVTRTAARIGQEALKSAGDEAQAARHLAAGVAVLERKGAATRKGALAVFRLAQGDHAAARRLLADFLAKPAELVERRVLELSLSELAEIPGADRALIRELPAQVRGS
jgi:hypothetical protein